MKNADFPAMPLTGDAYTDFAGYNPDKNSSSYNPECQGLTKREYAAIKIMASLALKSADYGVFDGMAGDAVAMADAVLEELEKSK